jgi:Ca2+-transporting ATPase
VSNKFIAALRGDPENTLLQKRLTYLTQLIAKMGSVAGLVLFAILMIRFFVRLGRGELPASPSEKGLAFVQILIVSVTLIVITIPEGMPLAVTLALAIATKRMTKENLLVRVLGSCETMANASVICTDKTGTLTQNVMTVVAGSVGVHAKFVRNLEENKARSDAREGAGDAVVDQIDLNSVLSAPLRNLFNEAIALNSTAFEDIDADTGKLEFVGSKTETALLRFAKDLGWADYHTTRKQADVVQIFPFASERKAMGIVVKLRNGKWRFYVKGASEVLTEKCTRHVAVTQDDQADAEVETKTISQQTRDAILDNITFYANQTLRTLALCYRDLDHWPPNSNFRTEDVPYDELACNLTLIGITGIEDPLRPGVREAVADCNRAGVQVKMCTGDNVLTARSIALQCGIFTPGGIIMEGPVFRQLDDRQLFEIVPKLQVLARSSPEDKKILVEKLRALGEITCVTGDGTNDGPALKTAHVGFSMGIAGTEIAKEASDIILMDDNFASIVKAIMWGRCVNDAVKKYLQFQIAVNISAVITTFISAATSNNDEAALTTVQLLWINIIMDTFAALALATDAATPSLLNRKPNPQSSPLFTVDMYKQIVFQASYQVSMIFILHFLGNKIFGYRPDPFDESVGLHHEAVLTTLIFNSFVFAQICNSVNARRIDRKKNVFKGILKNKYFLIITGIGE